MKQSLLFLLGLFFSLTGFASPVSQQKAQSLAQSFLSSKGLNLKQEARPFRAPKKASATSAEQSYYYVFNVENEGGYVFISGDDRTEQVLGFVDKGSFDPNNVPENMRSWLQFYADQIQYLDDNNIQIDGEAARAHAKARRISKTRHSIPILIKSRWNQGDPYNMSCPDYYKEDGTTAKPASGCVATALAQVMNFYKYPAKTSAIIPSHSNTYKVVTASGALSERKVTARALAKGTKIDWENMCDVYDGDETEAQRKAVGDLMLYVGQSVKMGWGASSGASFGSHAASSFIQHFGYNTGTYVASRGRYTIDEWFDLLYHELETGHPIGFAGHSSGGGHAFVIDGFDGDQLFHVNWGWGGSSDGWFLINVLNAGDKSGIGASSSSDGYSMGQNALIGVNPLSEEQVETRDALTIHDISCEGTSVKGRFINWSGKANNFVAAMVVYDVENDVYELVKGTEQNVTNIGINIVRTLTLDLNKKLSPGTYRLSPASRLQTNTIYRPELNCRMEYVLAEVNAQGVPTLTYVKPEMNIEVVNVEYPGTLSKGTEQEVRFTFKNNGSEFYKELHFFASVNDQKVYCENRAPIAIKPGETAVSSFYFTPDSVSTYNLWLCTGSDGKEVVYHTTVDIVDPADAAKASLYFNSIKINNASTSTIYGNIMDGSIVIRNQKNIPFNGRVKIQLWRQKEEGSSTYQSNQSCVKEIQIPASRTLTVPFTFEDLTFGRNYEVVVNYVGQDGSIENGGLWKGHRFLISQGILYWKNTGVAAGVADKAAFTTPNTACGVYINGGSVEKITKNKNPNTFYVVESNGEAPKGVEDYNFVFNSYADTLRITDGYAYYSPIQVSAGYAEFNYTVPSLADSVKWDAFTLPFAATTASIDGVDYQIGSPYNPFFIFDFTAIENDNTPIFEQAAQLRGNTPYLIAADSSIAGKTIVFKADNVQINKSGSVNIITSSNAYNFYGITLQTSVKNVYVLNDKGTAYEYVSSSTVDPLDTYFTTSLPDDLRLESIVLPDVPVYVPNPNPDAIVPVWGTISDDMPVYSVTGQIVGKVHTQNGIPQLQHLPQGVYVIGGKKFLVK